MSRGDQLNSMWAKGIAIIFKEELPEEYLREVIADENYIWPIIPYPEPPRHGMWINIPVKKAFEIECKSIDCLNKYYSIKIKEQLAKILNEVYGKDNQRTVGL